MFEVDARGLSCPEPVLLTAQALKTHQNEKVRVLVDEAHTKANVLKFVQTQNKIAKVTESGTEFEIVIE